MRRWSLVRPNSRVRVAYHLLKFYHILSCLSRTRTAVEWWKGKERKDHGYDLGDMVRQTSDYAGFLEAEKYERIAVVPFEEVTWDISHRRSCLRP